MNKDIVPELLEEIKNAFVSKSKESKILKEKLIKLKNKRQIILIQMNLLKKLERFYQVHLEKISLKKYFLMEKYIIT